MTNLTHMTTVTSDTGNTSTKNPVSRQETPLFELLCRKRVSEIFYIRIRTHVTSRIYKLEYNQIYTLSDICGDCFWKQLSSGDQRLAGICMSDMVARELLPLSVAVTRHEYPKCYRLK